MLSVGEASAALGLAYELGTLVRDAPRTADPGLATGEAGHAVALAYLHDAFPDDGFGAAADEALRVAVRGIATGRSEPSLMLGFTGVAWATAHLARREGVSADGAVGAIDAALIDLLERRGWSGGFDLVSGVCGVGIYALERLDAPAGRRLLELTVDALDALSMPGDPGTTWLARPEGLHGDILERAPQGFLDAGLAHGVAGPVGVLAGAVSAGVERAEPLLDGAVEWLSAIVLPEPSPSLFPYGFGGAIDPTPARLAWCYGDPGIAAALLLAAQAGNDRARGLATRALAKIEQRDDAGAGVQGASLCHGTAGLAHLCSRLGLGALARHWIAITHELRDPDKELGGYSVVAPEDTSRPPGDVQGLGLLGGIAGVALALLAAATATAPEWDRALLISPAPAV